MSDFVEQFFGSPTDGRGTRVTHSVNVVTGEHSRTVEMPDGRVLSQPEPCGTIAEALAIDKVVRERSQPRG